MAWVLVVLDLLVAVVTVSLTESIGDAWLAASALRTGVVLNALLNEWGHIAVAALLRTGRPAEATGNWLGNRPVRAHLLALVPGIPDLRGDLFVRIGGLSRAQARAVREGGFALALLASCASILWVIELDSVGRAVAFAYVAGTLCSFVSGFFTDLI